MLTRAGMAVVVVLLLAAVAAGCGDDDDAGTAAAAGGDCPTEPVRFAVEPYESASLLLPAFKPIADAVGEELGCEVELMVTQNYTAEIEAMRNDKLEIGQFGPFGYVLAADVADAEAVIQYSKDGKPATYFASIVVPADSEIESLAELRGKSFAYSDPASTSGFLFPASFSRRPAWIRARTWRPCSPEAIRRPSRRFATTRSTRPS